MSAQRRYDIDWLRVIAIGFLLIYHIAIPFQPWGVFIGFIQNDTSLQQLWVPMSILNIWRIPLLFFVSGMGVYFSLRKRNWKSLFKERSLRILLPFVFGTLVIVPVQFLLFQQYYNQDLSYFPIPAHLWFLGNIFSYVILLSPLMFFLKRNEEKYQQVIAKWLNHPLKLILVVVPFAVAATIIAPDSYVTYADNLHGYVLGFLAFLFGYLFVYAGESFWKSVCTWKWAYLGLGILLYSSRIIQFEDFEAAPYLMALETVAWIYAILGIGYRFLNFSNQYLTYLSSAAYPVYIVHWLFINIGCILIFPLEVSPMIKFVLVNFITFGGSLLMYELIIKRIHFLRPLFGLKQVQPTLESGNSIEPIAVK
jgi:glucan biosynthesis protein C